jgi:hypothetical protein
MFFSSLAGLWFGLTLPAILMLYLFKRKYIDTDISSHLLWNRVLRNMEANRPWQKLQNQLLLWLQLLAAALLVLAIMQPQLWVSHEIQAHVVVVLDRSASMQALVAAEGASSVSRMELAKQEVLNYLEDSGTQAITLIAVGGKPEVLLTKEANADVWQDVITDIEPYHGKAAYKETMSLASAIARGDQGAQVVLFTDGQWADSAMEISFDKPVLVKKLPDLSQANVSVVQFGVKQAAGQASGDESIAVTSAVTLKNWGDEPQQVQASIFAENELVDYKQLSFTEGEQKTFYFEDAPAADYYRLQLEADQDVLIEDNTAYAFLNNKQGSTAVLLSEGNLFLEKALQLSGVDVIKAQPGADGMWILPEGMIDFVVVDRVSEESYAGEAWSQKLREVPVWYIAAGFGSNVSDIAPKQEFEVVDHAVTQYLQFQEMYIARAKDVRSVPWGEAVLYAGDLPLIYAGTEAGIPRLAFTFSFQQTDLTLRSEFPILVQNAVEWLSTEQGGSLGSFVAGEVKALSLSAKAQEAAWVKQDRSLSSIAAKQVNNVVSEQQMIPEQQGLYQFVVKDASGEQLSAKYAASVLDPKESNLSFQPRLQFFVQSTEGQGDTSLNPLNSGESAAGKVPYPLMRWIALAVLLLIILEWGVYQRGSSV